MTSRLAIWGLTTAVAAGLLAAPRVAAQQPPARGSAELLATLAAKPTPKAVDGRIDFSGMWDHLGGIEFVQPRHLADGSVCVRGCAKEAVVKGGIAPGTAATPAPDPTTNFPKYKPEFAAKVKQLNDQQVKHDTVLQCHAPGVPRIGPPQKIVQGRHDVVFLYDDPSGAFFRVVPIDGRSHRKDMPASYLGDAIGRFEGDTLVVETVNFNEETWLTDDGAFHTKDLKVIERLRRVGDTIQYEAIAHDPAVLAEPWVARRQTLWITDLELEEPARCDDRDLAHVVDGTSHDNPR
jgi:hypothetical protein